MLKEAVFMLAMTVSATAAAEGFYLQGGLGVSRYNDSDKHVTKLANGLVTKSGFSSAVAKMDRGSGMLKLGLGYQINSNLAVEGGFTHLGVLDMSATTTGPTAAMTAELVTYGWELSMVGRYPINEETKLYGRLGAYAWDSKVEDISGNLKSSVAFNNSDGTDLTFGAGIEYKAWRFEYQRYKIDKEHVDTFQVAYRFNL